MAYSILGRYSMDAHFKGMTKILNINDNQLNMYYSDWNNDREDFPTIFLLHGAMAHWLDWKYQIAAIEDIANVIAIDIRGHGLSDFGYGFNLDILLQDIESTLVALGIKKCIIGGHSFGGIIALVFARNFPEKTKGLILVDSSYEYEPLWDDRLVELLPEIITQKLLFSDNLIARFIAKKMYFSPNTSKEIIDEYLNDHIDSIDRYSPKVFKCYKCVWGFNSIDWLADITVPSLVVVGKDDKIILPAEAEKLSQLLPDARLVKLESGHLPMYEDYKDLNRAIIDLIELC